MELAKHEQGLLFFTTPFWRLDEEKGKLLVVQAQEGVEAHQEPGDSSVLLEASEQAAHTLNDTSECSHRRPDLDATER
jgi:hypothetical protein